MRSLLSLLLALSAIVLALALPIVGASPAEEGKAFLAANAKAPGVVTLPNGLQYRVIESGAGPNKPTDRDTVTVHYAGRLIDGTEFDSSYKRGSPASFGVTQVIAGWTNILKLMQEGDRWEVFIPSDLAYGKRGAGRSIPGDSTLIFTIELISIKGKTKNSAADL